MERFSGWAEASEAESVFYRTLDPIRNLRLKVCIRRLYGKGDRPDAHDDDDSDQAAGAAAQAEGDSEAEGRAAGAGASGAAAAASAGGRESDGAGGGDAGDDRDRAPRRRRAGRRQRDWYAETTVQWQQKLFGPRETATFVAAALQRREARTSAGSARAAPAGSRVGVGALRQLAADYAEVFDKRLMRSRPTSDDGSGLEATGEETDGATLLAELGGIRLWTVTDVDAAALRRDLAAGTAAPAAAARAVDSRATPLADVIGADGEPLKASVAKEAAAGAASWLSAADAASLRRVGASGADPDGRSAAAGAALLRNGVLRARGGQAMRVVASVDVDAEAFVGRGAAAATTAAASYDRVLCEVRAYATDNLVEALPGFSLPDPEAALRARQRRWQAADAAAGLEGLRRRAGAGAGGRGGAGAGAGGFDEEGKLDDGDEEEEEEEAEAGAAAAGAVSGPRESQFAGRRTYRFLSPAGHTYEFYVCNADDEAEADAEGADAQADAASLQLLDQLEAAEALAAADLANRAATAARPPPGIGAAARLARAPPGPRAAQRAVVRVEICGAAAVDGEAGAMCVSAALLPGGGWRVAALREGASEGQRVRAGALTSTAWCQPQRRRWRPTGPTSLGGLAAARQRKAARFAGAGRAAGGNRGRIAMTLTGDDGRGALGAAGGLLSGSDAGGAQPGLECGSLLMLAAVSEDDADGPDGAGRPGGDAEDGDEESGVAEACGCAGRGGAAGLVPVAHWNHCLEVELVRDAQEEDQEVEASCPRLALTCLERDGWGLVRVLGYGRADVATEPGCAARTVRLWRPAHSRAAAVADFFLGGASRLVDLDERDGLQPAVVSSASRFGLSTVEGAQVHIRFDTILHRATFAGESGSWRPPQPQAEAEGDRPRTALQASAQTDAAASTVSMGRRATTRELIDASRTLRRRAAVLAAGRAFASLGRPGGLPPLRPPTAGRPPSGGSTPVRGEGVAAPRRRRPNPMAESAASDEPLGVPPVDDVVAADNED